MGQGQGFYELYSNITNRSVLPCFLPFAPSNQVHHLLWQVFSFTFSFLSVLVQGSALEADSLIWLLILHFCIHLSAPQAVAECILLSRRKREQEKKSAYRKRTIVNHHHRLISPLLFFKKEVTLLCYRVLVLSLITQSPLILLSLQGWSLPLVVYVSYH